MLPQGQTLTAIVALIVTTLLAGGTQEMPTAVATNPAVGVGVHQLDRQSIRRLEDLGVRHVRHTLYWSHWGDRAYRTEWEAGLRRALQAGLEPLVVVHQPPSGSFAERRRVYEAFARFMEERAAQFPEVQAWQLWNEMDLGTFTDLFGARDGVPMRERGRHYGEMLKLAYPAIKRGNPNALVVTGGIASGIQEGFLEGLYSTRAPFDVLAIHTYGFPLWEPFRDRGLATRRIMRSHADTRPLWNTEFGLEAGVIPANWPHRRPADIDGFHLQAWQTAIEGNSRDRIYDRIYGHVLVQGGDLSYDLVRSNGSPRPAYQWLKGWFAQR